MNYRNVYGGTPVGNESRCDTCSHARVKVAECSTYEDKRLPCYYQMQQIAWDLCSKRTSHTAGFVIVRPAETAEEQDD